MAGIDVCSRVLWVTLLAEPLLGAGCFKVDVGNCTVACATSVDCPGSLVCTPRGLCGAELAACDGTGDGPVSDARVDATPTSVSVQVLTMTGDGLPDTSARVVFELTGGGFADLGVDAQGFVSSEMVMGGAVTVIREVGNEARLHTVMQVMPGASLTFGLPRSPAVDAATSAAMTATITPLPSGTGHAVATPCGKLQLGTMSSATLVFRPTCQRNPFPLFAHGINSSGTQQFVFLDQVALTDGGTVTVPNAWMPMSVFGALFSMVPPEVTAISLNHFVRFGAFDAHDDHAFAATAGASTVNMSTVAPVAVGESTRDNVHFLHSSGLQTQVLSQTRPGSAATVGASFAAIKVPWIVTTSLSVGTIDMAWAEEGTEASDGRTAEWHGDWSNGSGGTRAVTWFVTLPPGEMSIALPSLPAAYDRLVPDRNTPVRIGASHVTATEIDVVTSYADFIRFPDAHTVFEDVPLGIYPTAVRRVQALTREL